MARPLRIEYPNAVYHVTSHGNARNKIFLSDQDRVNFLFVLNAVVKIYLSGLCGLQFLGDTLTSRSTPTASRRVNSVG